MTHIHSDLELVTHLDKQEKIITFGCRLNFAESQIIVDNLKELGRNDVVVVHSCSVTKNADKESMQKVKELIEKHRADGKEVFVTGCSAQLDPDKYLALGAHRVIGNADKLKIDSYTKDQPKKIWQDIMQVRTIDSLPKTTQIEGKTRGLIQIQNGCNHDCTFCVIYKARGKNRSVPILDIIEQFRILLTNNYQEIVLTGVDITDYGIDLEGDFTLAKLLRKILVIFPEIKRLRLSSIDVAEIDDDLFELIATDLRIMPYIHLSLQSGSDLILKRMKRRHLSTDIRNFCFKLLAARSDIVFGADIIAGFPTETEILFAETVNLIQEIPNFIHLHIFSFSAHANTPAARMPQVNGKVIKERAMILRKIGYEARRKFYESKVNSIEEILFENNNVGKNAQFLKIKLDIAQSNLVGAIRKVKILNIVEDKKNILQPFYLEGTLI